jgi:cyclase
MTAKRIIPVLLIKSGGLWKGIQFRKHQYVGDPQNALRVFSEKMVDELVMLDIEATQENRGPDIDLIKRVANECYMPLKTVEDVGRVLRSGAEKVVIGTATVENPALIEQSANVYGRQSIVASIDYKQDLLGRKRVYIYSGKKRTKMDPLALAVEMEQRGAGEILVTSIMNEGSGKGLDIEFLKSVTQKVEIPVIGSGGVATIEDIVEGIEKSELSAVAVGSLVTFSGPHRSVLINYPTMPWLEE